MTDQSAELAEADAQIESLREQVDDLARALVQAGRELSTCRKRNAAIAAQLDQYRDERDGLRSMVAAILQSMPDTADEQEWRDRAGTLGVTDPDGQPYRAWTEDDHLGGGQATS
jgi:septal ring factor EnvC (AmiA/AmiB activator)